MEVLMVNNYNYNLEMKFILKMTTVPNMGLV